MPFDNPFSPLKMWPEGAYYFYSVWDPLLRILHWWNVMTLFSQVITGGIILIKGGGLEALLNISAGLVLLMLTIPNTFKSLLSIIFLLGAILHSGMLYLD